MANPAESEKYAVYNVISSNVIVKWQRSSKQNIAALFAISEENAPTAIIIDEIEGLCRSRQSSSSPSGDMLRITKSFLASITRSKGVTIIDTTDFPWSLDHGFDRRFRPKIHVELPSEAR